MKKTYKELSTEIDEALSFSARKAVGRRMVIQNKKPSVKFRKAKNMLRVLPITKARKRASKWVRNWVKQKLAGKGKNLIDMSVGEKEKLEIRTDKKIAKMGKVKITGLVNKHTKKIIKKHEARKKSLLAKKTPGQ